RRFPCRRVVLPQPRMRRKVRFPFRIERQRPRPRVHGHGRRAGRIDTEADHGRTAEPGRAIRFVERAPDRDAQPFDVVGMILTRQVRLLRIEQDAVVAARVVEDRGAGDVAVRRADNDRANGVGAEVDADGVGAVHRVKLARHGCKRYHPAAWPCKRLHRSRDMHIVRSSALLLAVVLSAVPASAQVRITGGISGIVADPSEALVPGATVQLTDEGTGITQETVTNSAGAFQFPNLSSGTYTVTVTLAGFQTAVYTKVAVEASRTTDLRIKLSVGAASETVTVSGASPILETTQNVVATTIPRDQIIELPLGSRDAFGLARLVPGAVAPAGTGSTHYNGMPGGTINPTIDGVNNSSNGFKSGGTSFFGTVPARLGAIEEVTVESAGLAGDAGVEGGVNLKFVTRRGTSKYHGSAFDEAQNDKFNANSYFNRSRGLPRPRVRRHDFGFNFGGPLLPIETWRDKLFLFVNYEQQWLPLTQTRSNIVLTDEATQGIFRYQTATGEVRTANLYSIAAASGFQATPDPLIAAMLSKESTARTLGNVTTSNLRQDSLSWVQAQTQVNYYPTARMDYQITPKLAWMGSWNLYRQDARGR